MDFFLGCQLLRRQFFDNSTFTFEICVNVFIELQLQCALDVG